MRGPGSSLLRGRHTRRHSMDGAKKLRPCAIDAQMKLEPSLTMRAVAGATWTADTAVVHHFNADHLALPVLARHLQKGSNPRDRKPEQREKLQEPVQMELLA
jgi:hypothetical protein